MELNILQDEAYASGREEISTLTASSRIMKELFVISLLMEEVVGMSHPSRVLEVGCGTGNLTPALRAIARTIVAFDLSTTGIEIARKRHCDLTSVTFLAGDGTAPKKMAAVAEGNFDLIFFREFHPFTRMYYQSREEAYAIHMSLLKDYMDLLIPNGVIIIQHAERNEQAIRPEVLELKTMEILISRSDPRLLAIFFVLLRNRVRPALCLARVLQPILWRFSTKNLCYVLRKRMEDGPSCSQSIK